MGVKRFLTNAFMEDCTVMRLLSIYLTSNNIFITCVYNVCVGCLDEGYLEERYCGPSQWDPTHHEGGLLLYV